MSGQVFNVRLHCVPGKFHAGLCAETESPLPLIDDLLRATSTLVLAFLASSTPVLVFLAFGAADLPEKFGRVGRSHHFQNTSFPFLSEKSKTIY